MPGGNPGIPEAESGNFIWSRRDLISLAGWGAILTCFAVAGGAILRLLFPRVLFEPPTSFKAGYPTEYTVGDVSEKWMKSQRVWVVRTQQGLYALLGICTHLGCTPSSLGEMLTNNYVWRSIFRHGYADTPRNRVLQVSANVWLHLHPSKMRRHGIRYRHTWCAGGLTFLLYLCTVVTGVVLMFYYRPTGEYAYWDIKYLDFDVPFGMIMRNMHRWSAHGMVIFIWLHMFRVFMTGSYKPPREFNWVVGVNLLTLTLLLSFTGYLLPWDQLAIWAVTVGTNMARATPLLGNEGPFGPQLGMTPRYDARALLTAGTVVGAPTLLRFYVLHCIFIPIIASILMILHFWRIRKDGGISGPL